MDIDRWILILIDGIVRWILMVVRWILMVVKWILMVVEWILIDGIVRLLGG